MDTIPHDFSCYLLHEGLKKKYAYPINQRDDEGKPWGIVNGTVIGDIDPKVDDCSRKGVALMQMIGQNVGDLLNAKNLTWGWFQGGFRPTERSAEGSATCASSHKNINGTKEIGLL